jgi:hypothetical protein
MKKRVSVWCLLCLWAGAEAQWKVQNKVENACSGRMLRATCADAIAGVIVRDAERCFGTSSVNEVEYIDCARGFCDRECGKGFAGCSRLCQDHAGPLFDKFRKKKASMEAPAAQNASSKALSFLERARAVRAPEDDLAKEMTHDLEMNFNKIAPFGKEDTARELQDHAAKTQDTLVDAVENAEVAEIKRAVFRALTRLRAATIKEFDTIARLETQAIDAYNDAHHYRAENPLAHLHEDEAPVETDKLKSFH